jgi:hypothetical protein
MGKLNKVPKRDREAIRTTMQSAVGASVSRVGTGPMKTKKNPTTTTHEGAPAFQPKLKTELFQLAVSNMVGEKTFYEKADDRDARFAALVRKVAVKDPAWMLGFLRFLRGTANMRTASIVAAAEAVKARLDAGIGGPVIGGAFTRKPSQPVPTVEIEADPVTSRKLIDAALQRADEPGELLAYWLANHGRNVPKPVKRGLGDAATRLYNEYSLMKYDTASHGVRFADVLDLTHPTPATPAQGALFKYALDRRHGRDVDINAETLPMVWENAIVRERVAEGVTGVLLDSDILKHAGMTWEDALSLAGSKVDKAKLWEAMIPNMGIMALIRNLRNFDEAGVSDKAAAHVIARLTDPAQIAKSRQLPFRFYTAYLAAPSDRWKHALGVALDLACANVPALPGRTLVLIDTSASMTNCTISEKSQVTAAQAAAVLGMVLAKRCGADVWGWASGQFKHDLVKGQTAMQGVTSFLARTGEAGHGTDIAGALRLFKGHDRVFLLSDIQGMGSYSYGRGGYSYGSSDMGGLIPANVPLYTFVLNGYQGTPVATGTPNRHALAGFSDATFKLVPLLELGESPDWDTLFNATG